MRYIISAILASLMLGCGGYVSDLDYLVMQKLCESNGGVKKMYVSRTLVDWVECENGAQFNETDVINNSFLIHEEVCLSAFQFEGDE